MMKQPSYPGGRESRWMAFSYISEDEIVDVPWWDMSMVRSGKLFDKL